jgi:hypothetical protein
MFDSIHNGLANDKKLVSIPLERKFCRGKNESQSSTFGFDFADLNGILNRFVEDCDIRFFGRFKIAFNLLSCQT